MKNIHLNIYAYETQKHHGILLYEWLLEFAKKNNIHGGFVTKAIAGYGHLGKIHEGTFFELASNVPVCVSFIMKKEEVDNFLNLLKYEEIELFYELFEVECGRV